MHYLCAISIVAGSHRANYSDLSSVSKRATDAVRILSFMHAWLFAKLVAVAASEYDEVYSSAGISWETVEFSVRI